MVMPRAFSSGALSMLSNDRNTIFGLCFCKTFVMAAVNVVLPWSMWPMVPTLQCGLLRSNFSFALSLLHVARGALARVFLLLFRCSLHLRYDFLRNGSRSLLIAREVH